MEEDTCQNLIYELGYSVYMLWMDSTVRVGSDSGGVGCLFSEKVKGHELELELPVKR